MDRERWQKIKTIFDCVIDLSPRDRGAALDRLCPGESELRCEVQALIDADTDGPSFDAHARELRATLATDWVEGRVAPEIDRIGAWKVVRELGQGGMGVIYLVERADGQFTQQGALKLIKRGMDSEAMLSRFLRERQILARIEHRNIARLLDGGIAADGRPYFVMEYIDGAPLLQYCREHVCKLEERLRLFFGVCNAVQFAHRQLIVHSDIKPSNVLVNREHEAKLLDFGIAKLLDDQGAESGPATLARDRPLTPAYAAPEQLAGEPVSTATDVYGLGCLLYELLTGRRPFEIGDVPTRRQLERVLESAGPARPSEVNCLGAPIAVKQLRGDLDTIVLKALRRDPDRRYSTVSTFAEDLKRFQRGLPITSQPDTPLYRAKKFVGRHLLGVTTTAMVVVSLLCATAISLYEVQKARIALNRADVEKDFLLSTLNLSNAFSGKGKVTTVAQLLVQTAQRVDEDLLDQPVVRAELHDQLGNDFWVLGDLMHSRQEYERNIVALKSYLPETSPEVYVARTWLLGVMENEGEFQQAVAGMEEMDQSLIGRDSTYEFARSTLAGFLAISQERAGNFDRASARYEEAQQSAARLGVEATIQHTRSIATRTMIFRGRYEDAAKVLDETSTYWLKDDSPVHPVFLSEVRTIGTLLDNVGRARDAELVLRRATLATRAIFGPAQMHVAETMAMHAEVLSDLGDFSSAHAEFEQILEKGGAGHFEPPIVNAPFRLSDVRTLIALTRLVDASAQLRMACEEFERVGDAENAPLIVCQELRLEIALAQGNFDVLSELDSVAAKQLARMDRDLPRTYLAIAKGAAAEGDRVREKQALENTLDALQKQQRPWHPIAYEAYLLQAEMADAVGSRAQAEEARIHAFVCALVAFGAEHPRTKELEKTLVGSASMSHESLLARAHEIVGPPVDEKLYRRALEMLDRTEAVLPKNPQGSE